MAKEKIRKSHNREHKILDAAAFLFADRGFRAATIRDIAQKAGMLPGSVYYHFASKSELLSAVYEEGVQRMLERLVSATSDIEDPWTRFEAGCTAHLESLVDKRNYSHVMLRVLPDDAKEIRHKLKALRDDYEDKFIELISEVDLPEDVDERYFRLQVLGCLNWAGLWYDRKGASPAEIVKQFLGNMRITTPSIDEP